MKKTPNSAWRIELIEVCRILKNNGIDIEQIPTRKTAPDKKRVPTTINDINFEEIDIAKIVEENGLDGDFPIGYYITRFRSAYNGREGNMTEDERIEGKKLGIVSDSKVVSMPIFKGRKLSEFHLIFISEILDELLSGKVNTIEALERLQKASIENGEAVIKSPRTIIRGVEILLKDKPEQLEKYHRIISDRSNVRSRAKSNQGVGFYYENQNAFKRQIIEDYLPLILAHKTTFANVATELSTTYHTINRVIEDYYIKKNDIQGLLRYREIRQRNSGASVERRQIARENRAEVANYDLVSNNEFLGLTSEEQEAQVLMKIRLEKLKEEQSPTNKRKSALLNEDIVRGRINHTMDYFRSKNNFESGDIYFSDEDIRFMIFRYPTLISRTNATLDEKIATLTSYDELDEETVYAMIKAFPGTMGYEPKRLRNQLDILKEEGLIDAVVTNPQRLKLSPELIYALIQFAKAKRKTSDLTGIKRANIFLSNASLKRAYHVTFDEIKARYPYISIDYDNSSKVSAQPSNLTGKTEYEDPDGR